MPILKGSIAFSRFQLVGAVPKDVRRWVTKALTAHAFEPIDLKSDDDRSAGFVELEATDRTDFSPGAVFQGEHALFSWKVMKLRVPSAVVKSELATWAQAFEEREGRAPGRRERAEQKDTIRKALRSKQEPAVKVFDVQLNLDAKELLVWASSRNIVDEVLEALATGLDVKLVPRVPASFVRADVLDALEPTKELLGEVAS